MPDGGTMPTEPRQPGDELIRRLDELDARLARLEASLGLGPLDEPATPAPVSQPPRQPAEPGPDLSAFQPEHDLEPEPSPAAPPAERPVADEPSSPSQEPQPAGTASRVEKWSQSRSIAGRPPGRDEPADTAASSRGAGSAPMPPKQPKAPMVPKREPKKPVSLEELIGGKLFAIIGPLIVLAGLAFGAKVAWDAGWLRLSETARCIGIAGFGAALLVIGEVTGKRLGRAASGSMTAIGIGAMYVAAWAAYGQFELIPAGWAFGMMAAVAVMGLALSLRAGLPVVAILSLLGGYAAPLLTRADSPTPIAMPLYVITLTVIGLGLSAWRPRFVALRTVCWWAGGLVATLWMLIEAHSEPLIALALAAAMWGLFHLELLASSRHAEPERRSRWLSFRAARPMIASLSTTAWAAVWLAYGFNEFGTGTAELAWVGPAGLAVVCSMLWLVLAGGLDVIRDVPDSPRGRLGVVFACEAGALVIIAVALGVSGWMEAASWIAMGVAACFAGRWLRAGAMAWYGYVVLTLATARILTYDLGNFASAPGYAVGGLELTGWSALVLALGLGWCAAGLLSIQARTTVGWVFAQIALGLGALTGSFFVAHENATAQAVAVTWAAFGLVTFVAFRAASPERTGRLRLVGGQIGAWVVLALGGVAAIATRWFDLETTQISAGLVITDATAAPFAVGLAMVATAWIARRILSLSAEDGQKRSGLSVFGIGNFIGGVLVLASAVHVDAEPAALAVLYVLLAVALVPLDRFDRRLATIAVAAVAWVGSVAAWGMMIPGWLDGLQQPLLHPGLWIGLLIAAAAPWVARGVASSAPGDAADQARHTRQVGWAAAVLVVFIATSFEVARSAGQLVDESSVERGALSVWWTLFGVGLVIVGSVRRIAAARYAGLAIMAVAAAKVLLFDLIGLSQAVRAVSFIVVGLLFVGVAAGYLRLRKGGAGDGAQSEEGGLPPTGPSTEQRPPDAPPPDEHA